jgi:hypothetical protein
MTNQHPITPPPELVQQWREESSTGELHFSPQYLATRAARWGADQELEACVEWLRARGDSYALALATSRRPKPLTLKEQALALLEYKEYGSTKTGIEYRFMGKDADTIRRALEALPND